MPEAIPFDTAKELAEEHDIVPISVPRRYGSPTRVMFSKKEKVTDATILSWDELKDFLEERGLQIRGRTTGTPVMWLGKPK